MFANRHFVERRRARRYGTFGAAYVFVGSAQVLECVVRELSEMGASLQITGEEYLAAAEHVPDEVEIWLPSAGVKSLAQVIWRNRSRFGIRFQEEEVGTVIKEMINADVQKKRGRLSSMLAALRAGEYGNPHDRHVAPEAFDGDQPQFKVAGDAAPGAPASGETQQADGREAPSSGDKAAGAAAAAAIAAAAPAEAGSLDDIIARLQHRLRSANPDSEETRILRRVIRDLSFLNSARPPDGSAFGRRRPFNLDRRQG